MAQRTTLGDIFAALIRATRRFSDALPANVVWDALPLGFRESLTGPDGITQKTHQSVVSEDQLAEVTAAVSNRAEVRAFFVQAVSEAAAIRAELEHELKKLVEDAASAASTAALAFAVFEFEPQTDDSAVASVAVDTTDADEPVMSVALNRTTLEGSSRRFRNIFLQIGESAELAAHGWLFGQHVLEHPSPLQIFVGLGLLLRCAWKAAKIPFTELEASVFWGVVAARDAKNNRATFAAICEQTAAKRELVKRDPLPDAGVRKALEQLAQLRSVRKVSSDPEVWELSDSYTVTYRKSPAAEGTGR